MVDRVREAVVNIVDIDVNLGFPPVVIAKVMAWMNKDHTATRGISLGNN